MTRSGPDGAAKPPSTGWLDGRMLARYGLPGFAGSLLLTIGAFGVGWLPLKTGVVEIAYVEALRGTTLGTLMSRALIFVGVALLLQAWLILGHDLLADRDDPHALVDATPGSMTAILAAWCAPLLIAPPLFSRDVYSYFAQGRVLDMGADPYSTGVSVVDGWFQDGVDPMWAETPTPYGPFFLLISRGVANFATDQPALAALVFRVIALIGLALLVVYVPRLAFLHGINPSRALWLGVLNPLVVMHFVAGAHNDALMAGLVVMGLCLAAERHAAWGAAAIALAASVKPIAFLALPFIGLQWAGLQSGWWQRIRGWLLAGVVAGAVFLATALLAGVGFGWISALSAPGEVRTWLSPPTAIGMIVGGGTTWLGLTIDNNMAVAIARLIGAIAGLGIVVWLILRPEGRSPVRGCALAFVAVVVLGPAFQPWYLLWFLPLFAATGLTATQLRWVILLIAGFSLHGMAESSATSDNLFEFSDGLAILAAFAVVGLVLLVSPRERRLVLGGPLSHGLLPTDAPAEARAKQSVFRGRIGPQEGRTA
ncbi:MAG: polyprenol phosphomannose-dependent alpha 1,6 mannosyltransferase MptB [Actinomycetota bacterium]